MITIAFIIALTVAAVLGVPFLFDGHNELLLYVIR
jgi:hypothetical protein